MRAALLCALAAASCSAPQYGSGDLQCAPTGRACPDGFYCAGDAHCWLANTGPGSDGGTTASLCASSGALLCDGFEAATIDSEWQVMTTSGSATLDSTRHFRGAASLHLHIDAAASGTDPGATLFETRTFPVSGTLYVRAWFYFQSPFTGEFDQLINFVDTTGGGASFAMKADMPVNNDYSGAAYMESTTTPIPLDTWTCLRFQLSQSGATGALHLFVDGKEADDAALTSAPIATMRGLYVGLDFFGNPALPPADAWLDEVIVDDKPVTCAE